MLLIPVMICTCIPKHLPISSDTSSVWLPLPLLPCLRLLTHLEEERKGGKLNPRDSTNYTGGLRSIQEGRGGVFGTIC